MTLQFNLEIILHDETYRFAIGKHGFALDRFTLTDKQPSALKVTPKDSFEFPNCLVH